jgi:DNA-binding transcriptional regulator LsrR (DeoR family)
LPGMDEADRTLWRLVAEGCALEVLAEQLGVSERSAKRMIAALRTLYRVRTRRRGCDLRFGQMSRLRQDRGLCLSGSYICS